jgi:hypothetical protein
VYLRTQDIVLLPGHDAPIGLHVTQPTCQEISRYALRLIFDSGSGLMLDTRRLARLLVGARAFAIVA